MHSPPHIPQRTSRNAEYKGPEVDSSSRCASQRSWERGGIGGLWLTEGWREVDGRRRALCEDRWAAGDASLADLEQQNVKSYTGVVWFQVPSVTVFTYHEGKCSHLLVFSVPHTDSVIIQMIQFCKLTKLNNSIIHRSKYCCGSWCEVKNSRGN